MPDFIGVTARETWVLESVVTAPESRWWLRVTQFHLRKSHFGDVDNFQGLFCIPAGTDDESLSLICERVDRLIRYVLDRVQHDQTGKRLHRRDAQLLNGFQAGVTVRDPF